MNKEKTRFIILKETYKEKFKLGMNEEEFNKKKLKFSYNQFVEQVGYLYREGHLTKPIYADDTIPEYTCKLTSAGEKYYIENKWQTKVIKSIKGLFGLSKLLIKLMTIFGIKF